MPTIQSPFFFQKKKLQKKTTNEALFSQELNKTKIINKNFINCSKYNRECNYSENSC